jgi:hypothetical protein
MNFFNTIIGSFYSPAIYAQARTPQPGMKLLYSFLLVLLTSLVVVVVGASKLDRLLMQPADDGQPPLLDRVVSDLAAQVPVMVLHDGVLQVKEKQPYMMYVNAFEPEEKSFALVTIDTTGATTVHNMQTPVLITAREVYFRGNNDTKVYPLKQSADDTKPLIINQAVATDAAQRGLQWLHQNIWKIYLGVGAIGWIGFALVAYLLRLVMLMALGLAGLLLSAIWKPTVDFSTAVRVAAVAYTPVAIFSAAALSITGSSGFHHHPIRPRHADDSSSAGGVAGGVTHNDGIRASRLAANPVMKTG